MTLLDDLLDLVRKTRAEGWNLVEKEDSRTFIHGGTGLCLRLDTDTNRYSIGKIDKGGFFKAVYVGSRKQSFYSIVEAAYLETKEYGKAHADLTDLISRFGHKTSFSF